MDPLRYSLPFYQQLPVISQAEFQDLTRKTKVVLYQDLVVNVDNFNHPGYNNILQQFQGKDIAQPYTARGHSMNADLVVCHRAVGRLESSPLQQESKNFYNNIKNNELIKKHEQIVAKFNFEAPLSQTISQLKKDQLQIMTQIPKYFNQPERITFLKGKFANWRAEEHFWISLSIFSLEVILALLWVQLSFPIMQVISSFPWLALGSLTWTILEYYFHRFELHSPGSISDGYINSHLLHHSFPNLKNKVALSWSTLTAKVFLIVVVLRLFMADLSVGMWYLGFMMTIIAYDSIHYYCHFGGETNIGWLKRLRINHLKHHYRDQQTNFGVTTNFWDKIFGTYDNKFKDQ